MFKINTSAQPTLPDHVILALAVPAAVAMATDFFESIIALGNKPNGFSTGLKTKVAMKIAELQPSTAHMNEIKVWHAFEKFINKQANAGGLEIGPNGALVPMIGYMLTDEAAAPAAE